MNKKFNSESLTLVVIGLVLGYLIMMQSYSVESLNDIVARDRSTNVFGEIQILYDRNEELKEEIGSLEDTLEQYSDRASYLKAVQEEVSRYEMLAGLVKVSGPGIVVEVSTDKKVEETWFVDLVNEMFNGGAEAVSLQGVRLVEGTVGFDTLPTGQIFLNGNELTAPYVFKVIGPQKELLDSMNQTQGVVERMKAKYPGMGVNVEAQEVVNVQ